MLNKFKTFKLMGLGNLFIVFLFFASSPVLAKSTQHASTDDSPPVVVKTTPASGDQNVSASLKEIQIIFSQKMTPNSWSLVKVSDESFPRINGQIRYLEDQKTLSVPLQLEQDRDYVVWINSEKFHNFKDTDGRSAVPYLLKFHTKK